MKAEVITEKGGRSSTVIDLPGNSYQLISHVDEDIARAVAELFNSTIDNYVKSELSAKIEQIKAGLSDEWIEEQFPIMEIQNNSAGIYANMQTIGRQEGAKAMRNEVLNRLK